MDCRPTTLIPDLARLGVQLAAEVARSEAVWGLTRGAADREPGHGAAEKRAVGGGEKGSGAAVTASPSRHALASPLASLVVEPVDVQQPPALARHQLQRAQHELQLGLAAEPGEVEPRGARPNQLPLHQRNIYLFVGGANTGAGTTIAGRMGTPARIYNG